MELATAHVVGKLLDQNETLVIVSVLGRQGSTPAPLHASLVMHEDGVFGTVGGGTVEAQAIEVARRVLGTTHPEIHTISMDAQEASNEGMLCGGAITFLFEPLEGRQAGLWHAAIESSAGGDTGLFVVRVNQSSPELEVSRSWVIGRAVTDLDDLRRDAKRALASQVPTTVEKPGLLFLLDPVIVPDELLVFGAGHLAHALVPLASTVGFRCWVIDDRPDFASRERFPKAHKIMVADPVATVPRLPTGDHVWAVIVTRGHKDDARVLRCLLSNSYRYIGLIGSARKKEIIWESLIKEGTDPPLLDAVHCPIGLPLGGSTPGEIALSIAAELVAVKHGCHAVLKE